MQAQNRVLNIVHDQQDRTEINAHTAYPTHIQEYVILNILSQL